MTIQKPRTLAALVALTLAAACGGRDEGHAADSPAAATNPAATDTGIRPMNMMDSASRLPADSLVRLDSAKSDSITRPDSIRHP